MEKYESSDTDYQRYDRIWQRVAPNLNPYPDVRSTQESASVPHSDDPMQAAADDPCCMGTTAQNEHEVLSGFISEEWQHVQLYRSFMHSATDGEIRRLWHELQASALQHARRQMAAYYLITSQPFSLVPSCGKISTTYDYPDVLRRSYHAEACVGMNYIRAADETTDLCLSELWQQLGRESYDLAGRILQFLAKRM